MSAEKYPRAPEPVELTSKQPPVNDRTICLPRPKLHHYPAISNGNPNEGNIYTRR